MSDWVPSIQRFAERIRRENPKRNACYIAVMPSGEDGTYDLEVETVPHAIIGGNYATDTTNLALARRMADVLDKALRDKGFEVFEDREEWEQQEIYEGVE